MTAPDPVAMYREWLHGAWGAGDESVSARLIHADLIDHNPVPGQPPGQAGDVWAARQIRGGFPDLSFTDDVVFAAGDYVTGRWTMTGTHTGTIEMLGLPPTGRPVTMSGQEIWRIEDGQFVELWHAEDTDAMIRCLDLEPPKAMLRFAARASARRYRRGR